MIGRFFLPGPTEVRPEVLQAMLAPMMAHRGTAFEELFSDLQDGLRLVFDTTRPVYIGTCSATGLMEGGVRCAPAGRMLALVNGAFSERFAEIGRACGRAVETYDVAWGEAHDPAPLDARLRQGDFAVVTAAHSETSTGVLNDIRALGQMVRAHGARFLVDSVTGIGGAELHFDEWPLDYALTGSQKALALPPGLAFAAATAQFIEDARSVTDRGTYFDLVEYDAFSRKHQTPSTPALPLFYALARQLVDIRAEGMPARWARHTALAARTHAWVDRFAAEHGVALSVLAPPGHRSPTVTAIVLPAGLRGDLVVRRVAERGFTIGNGYGRLRDTTVRIGHMGDHTLPGLDACLEAVGETLLELPGLRA